MRVRANNSEMPCLFRSLQGNETAAIGHSEKNFVPALCLALMNMNCIKPWSGLLPGAMTLSSISAVPMAITALDLRNAACPALTVVHAFDIRRKSALPRLPRIGRTEWRQQSRTYRKRIPRRRFGKSCRKKYAWLIMDIEGSEQAFCWIPRQMAGPCSGDGYNRRTA